MDDKHKFRLNTLNDKNMKNISSERFKKINDKIKQERLKEIETLYKEKSLHAVNGYLKKNGIPHKVNIYNFGLQGNQKAFEDKQEFIAKKEPFTFKCHLYSISVKSRRSGWSYNKLRAKEIILL